MKITEEAFEISDLIEIAIATSKTKTRDGLVCLGQLIPGDLVVNTMCDPQTPNIEKPSDKNTK